MVGDEFIARGVVGEAEQEALVLCDPDGSFVQSLGLTHLPAFVHLRQDTTLVDAAEGWTPPPGSGSPTAWPRRWVG